jgi:hypothetical protein
VGNSSQERMTEPGETKHEGVAADRSPTVPRFTVAEFAAFLGLEEHVIRERIERRPNKREYYSIGELADRWRVSRGTVYNRLRSTGAKVLDFASSGRRGKKVVSVGVVLQIEARKTKKLC